MCGIPHTHITGKRIHFVSRGKCRNPTYPYDTQPEANRPFLAIRTVRGPEPEPSHRRTWVWSSNCLRCNAQEYTRFGEPGRRVKYPQRNLLRHQRSELRHRRNPRKCEACCHPYFHPLSILLVDMNYIRESPEKYIFKNF